MSFHKNKSLRYNNSKKYHNNGLYNNEFVMNNRNDDSISTSMPSPNNDSQYYGHHNQHHNQYQTRQHSQHSQQGSYGTYHNNNSKYNNQVRYDPSSYIVPRQHSMMSINSDEKHIDDARLALRVDVIETKMKHLKKVW